MSSWSCSLKRKVLEALIFVLYFCISAVNDKFLLGIYNFSRQERFPSKYVLFTTYENLFRIGMIALIHKGQIL